MQFYEIRVICDQIVTRMIDSIYIDALDSKSSPGATRVWVRCPPLAPDFPLVPKQIF